MSTHSITHHPIPTTVAAAAFVAAIAFAGVAVSRHDPGSPAPVTTSAQQDTVNAAARYQRPMHSGVQTGMP
jgi:pectin methylesterase-like acyl-CoA thioesterase